MIVRPSRQRHLLALLICVRCWLMLPALEFVGNGYHAGCSDEPFILLESVHHNNLGGKGPHTGAEGIVYVAEEHYKGTVRRIHVIMNAITEYHPWNIWANGMNGGFGVFNQNAGAGVTVRFTFTDSEGNFIKLRRFTMSIYDMDTYHSGTGAEEVIAHGYDESYLTKNTTVKRRRDENGKEVFFGGIYGDYDDNPVHIIHQSQRGKDKCIAFGFRDAQNVTMTFRSTPANAPRFTQFSTLNALTCNVEEELAEHPYPPSLLHPPMHVTHMVSPGESFQYVLPKNMFRSNSGGTLLLNATQENGSPLPAWLQFNPESGLFKGQSPKNLQGEVVVKVSAKDTLNGESASTSLIFKVEMGPIVAKPMPSKVVEPDTAISFGVPNNTFLGNNLRLSAQKSDGSPMPDWLIFDPHSWTFSGRVPREAHAQQLEIRLAATDDKQRRADELFSIVVLGAKENHPPTASLMPLQHARVGEQFSYVAPKHLFIDPDDDELTWDMQVPENKSHSGWLHYSSKTRQFFGVPMLDDVGATSIKACATDSHTNSVCTTLTVLVESLAGPTVGKPLELAQAKAGHSFSLRVPEDTFKSPSGASLKLQASSADGSQLPKWLHFDPDQIKFFGMPGPRDCGDAMIKLAATDPAGNSVTVTFPIVVKSAVTSGSISIEPIDFAPYAKVGQRFYVRLPEDTFRSLQGEGLSLKVTQPDGSPLPEWLHFDPKGQAFNGKPGAGDVGSIEVKVTATDSAGTSVSDVFVVNVVEVGLTLRKPIQLQHVVAGRPFVFRLPRGTFSPSHGDKLQFTVTKPDGSTLPEWLHFDSEKQIFLGKPRLEDAGDIEVKLVVRDDAGNSAIDVFPIVVSSSGPHLENPVPLRRVIAGEPFLFRIPEDTFKASPGGNLNVKATKHDGSSLPTWLHFNPENWTFSGEAPTSDAGEDIETSITLTESGISVSDTFSIEVVNRSTLTNYAPKVQDTGSSMLSWWLPLLWIATAGCILWLCGVSVSYKFQRVRKKLGDDGEAQVTKESMPLLA
eukprot:TRINITY_DN32320_c0_g1_i1.p1 TRINITY_DN32320_c0_g1~~TRINITY_DN32320_c0_g1_i1.p1  ORF type:complete len:1019 (+),score=145.59 TRINITY_DN32320_c0_g1_i1:109-3165(+)